MRRRAFLSLAAGAALASQMWVQSHFRGRQTGIQLLEPAAGVLGILGSREEQAAQAQHNR
jgi:hypothetical protein